MIYKKLGEICELITKGTTPTSIGFSYTNSGIRFLRAKNINYNQINFYDDDLFIDSKTNEALARSQIKDGDLLISIAGTIGRIGIIKTNNNLFNCNQAIAIVRLKKNIYKEYIGFLLNSEKLQNQIKASAVTGVISNLSLTQIGNLQIQLPPLDEQKKIVKKLNISQKITQLREKSIIKLNDLPKSIFIEMFGDPIINSKNKKTKKVKEVCNLINGLAFKPNEWEDEGLPIIRIQNLNDENKPFNYTQKKFDKKYLVTKGNVLFSWSGTPGTSFGCFKWNRENGWLNQHIFKVELNNNIINADYFILQMNMKINLLIAQAHGGVGLKHVTKGMVEDLDLIIPTIKEQNRFSNILNQISTRQKYYNQSYSKKKKLFTIIQQQVF